MTGPQADPGDFRAVEGRRDVDPVDVVSLLDAVYPRSGRQRRGPSACEFTALTRCARRSSRVERRHRIVEMSGPSRCASGPGGHEDRRLAALFDVIGTYRRAHDDPSVAAFRAGWTSRSASTRPRTATFPSEAGGLATVHRAKGPERDCNACALSGCVAVWADLARYYGVPPNTLERRLPALPGGLPAGGAFADGQKRRGVRLSESSTGRRTPGRRNRLAHVVLDPCPSLPVRLGSPLGQVPRWTERPHLTTTARSPRTQEPWAPQASESPSVRWQVMSQYDHA